MMSKVVDINKGNVPRLQPNGPDPTAYAFNNHILDAIDEFTDEHEMTVMSIIGVLETIKLNLYIQNTLEFEDED